MQTKTNAQIKVFSTDAAGPSRHDALELPSRRIQFSEGYEVNYFSRIAGHSISLSLLRALPAGIRWADVVHLTGTYSFPTLPTLALARLLRRPVVWSPRGAIQAAHEWRDAPRQRVKRRFEKFAQWLSPSETVLLVTAKSEAVATAARMPGMRVEIVPNSVELPPSRVLDGRQWRPNGRLRLLFLSRVHEKKGVNLLIEAMARLGPKVELKIYGTGPTFYLEKLALSVASHGLSDQVEFMGHVEGQSKTDAYRNADIFVLPSYSENFGIVVAEAMAHGVPVITTVNTPWTALDAEECGRCVPAEIDSLVAAITDIATNDLAAMGSRGRAWIRRDLTADVTNQNLLGIYRDLTKPGSGSRTK